MRLSLHPALRHTLLFAAAVSITLAWVQYKRPQAVPDQAGNDGRFAGIGASMASTASPDGHSPPDSAAMDATGQARQKVRELARRALGSGDSQEILEAMRGMTLVATPESLTALVHLMRHSQVHLTAVETLGELATNTADPDYQIRHLLRAAAENESLAIETRELADQIATRVADTLGQSGG